MKKLRYIALIGYGALFFLPILYNISGINIGGKLGGASEKTSIATQTIDSFWTGQFQDKYETWNKQELRINRLFIKGIHQLKYTFFGELANKAIVEGQDKYLFEKFYIDEYTGQSLLPEDEIDLRIRHFQVFQDSLKNHGIPFLFIIAPSKARIYSEKLPEKYLEREAPKTNYTLFKKKLTEAGIPLIDFNPIFKRQKQTSSFPLFPKSGTHWTDPGRKLALDTIFSEMEILLDTLLVKPIAYDSFISINYPQKSDKDLLEVQNLWIEQPFYDSKLKYYYFDAGTVKDRFKPNALIISDSFYWGFYNDFIQDKILGDESEFWYYIHQIWPNKQGKEIIKDLPDVRKNILEKDVVIFMITEGNLHGCCWGFNSKILTPLKKN